MGFNIGVQLLAGVLEVWEEEHGVPLDLVEQHV